MEEDNKSKINIKELNLEALAKVSGGYRYNRTKNKWLHDEFIKCPNCGYGIEALIKDLHVTNTDKELFFCYLCNQPFIYELTDEGVTSRTFPKK